jgi:hypothetical protein
LAATAPPLLEPEEESRVAWTPVMMATGVTPQHRTIMAAVPSEVQTHGFSGGGELIVFVTK